MKKFLTIFILAAALVPVLLNMGCGSSDDSGGDPVVACSITMTGPVGSKEYLFGEVVNINWDEKGSADKVSIVLLKDGLAAGTIHALAANSGYYFWNAQTFGLGSGSDYAIRVTALGETGCGDDSDLFTIFDTEGCNFTSTMTEYFILAPGDTCFATGGQYCFIDAGTDLDLTWQSESTSGSVDIELWNGDYPDVEFVGTIATNTPDDGSYVWTVDSFNYGADLYDYFIRISDRQVASCYLETAQFRLLDDDICQVLVTAPGLTANWSSGSTQIIEFEADPSTSAVEIRLYAGTELKGVVALDVPAAGGQYSWVVTNMGHTGTQTMFRIRVLDMADGTCQGQSSLFTISSK